MTENDIYHPEDYQIYLTISEWIERGDLDRYLTRLTKDLNERVSAKVYSPYSAKHRAED